MTTSRTADTIVATRRRCAISGTVSTPRHASIRRVEPESFSQHALPTRTRQKATTVSGTLCAIGMLFNAANARGFNFKAQPTVNPDQIHDLVMERWIACGENTFLLGPPGVCKTHLDIGLGCATAEADCSVLFVVAKTLMVQLYQAHEKGDWDPCLTRFVTPKLLIIDEFGYLPAPQQTAHPLFQLVAARYETGSIPPTRNQFFAD